MNGPPDSVWVFGYGSLVWRPDLDAVEDRIATLTGYERRFWQGSPDHRGTPAAPGRVLTLVDAPRATCLGRAYRLRPQTLARTLASLNHREKAGYAQETCVVHTSDGPVRALVYRALPGNLDWLGPAPIDEIAAHVLRSTGPSGSNREYVLRLHDALQRLGAAAGHVAAVADAVHRQEAVCTPK